MTTFNNSPVQVWQQSTVSLGSADIELLSQHLSPEERVRAARFVQPRDRRDFVAAHALLRRALSSLCDGTATEQSWRLDADEHGKPTVTRDDLARERITCSLSHTRGLVACAVMEGDGCVGIDVEEIAVAADLRSVAARYFSALEAAALEEIEPSQFNDRFTELWTLKEAYLKALGIGLAEPLTSFSFAFDSDSRLRFIPARMVDSREWSFTLAIPSDGYRLAVAIRSFGVCSPSISWRSLEGPSAVILRRT